MLALNHEKPLWMPNFYADSQCFISRVSRDMAPTKSSDGHDWFGTFYKYSAAQCSNTPQPGVLNEITEWREKVKWPDLDALDWSLEAENFVRDESKALFMRMSNGLFERLHAFEGFEQALIDMINAPDECRAFFERLADYKISIFNYIRDYIELDYIVAADDYGTARAPFFSTELYRKTLLGPTSRFVKAVRARGTKFVAHCCGKIDSFIPIMVRELKVDGLEIQTINDIDSICREYGDSVTVEYRPDPQTVHDSKTTEPQLREHVRDIIDRYGAQSVPGSGVVFNVQSRFKDFYYVMEDELYNYSLVKYGKIGNEVRK